MSADAGLLLSYYGDDFSGSTDVMEALTVRGLTTVLFLRPPAASDLRRFAGCRAVGVAGVSRSRPPAWMSARLPPVFAALKALGAPLCHYKVCSTFDSSPKVGSIGRAIEIGRDVFGTACVPMVVGAPALRRYVVFGNLFAAADGVSYRIDRHPTMSRHPVTPMDEGDIRRHLSRQTGLRSGLVDILALHAGRTAEVYEKCRSEGNEVVLFDTLDEPSLREAGRALWEMRPPQPSFVAGSSGVEYALLSWWAAAGLLPDPPALAAPGPAERVLVVSGSCSPGTERQIRWALSHDFEGVEVKAMELAHGQAEYARVRDAALAALSDGRSVLVYSALGPGSILGEGADFGIRLGERLGALAGDLVRTSGVRRVVIAGGDTSGHAGRALNIDALTMICPIAPGGPLCRAWSAEPGTNGLEILLKGGQVGLERLFEDVRTGRAVC